MKSVLSVMGLAALLAIAGCEGEVTSAPAADASAPAPPAPAAPGSGGPATATAPATAGAAAAPTAAPAATGAAAPVASAPGAADPAAMPAAAPGATTEAQPGVGTKGQNYGGPGIVTTPVETYFRTLDRIAFEVQIPNAMKLYKAEHNDKGPKTHEEYMAVIIKENGVQLPELPPGEQYVYDPMTEKLMISHPPKQPEAPAP
jgi:hypothetical protein